ncbi:nuclear export factor GLE1, partial [Micromonospora globispora]
MTMTRRARIRGAALLAAAVGALGWPGAAQAAEVTITTAPAQVHQGDAVEVTFTLPEERPGARTERIEIRLPAEAPVAEVYPMSVPGWAPRITTRTLDRPVAGIHAAGVNLVTDAVTWARAPGTAAAPARLALAMGPMPQTDRLAFQVVQTYSDGTVVRWTDPAAGAHPAPALTLLPPAPGAASGGHGGHGGAGC